MPPPAGHTDIRTQASSPALGLAPLVTFIYTEANSGHLFKKHVLGVMNLEAILSPGPSGVRLSPLMGTRRGKHWPRGKPSLQGWALSWRVRSGAQGSGAVSGSRLLSNCQKFPSISWGLGHHPWHLTSFFHTSFCRPGQMPLQDPSPQLHAGL